MSKMARPSPSKIVIVTCYDATFAKILTDSEAVDYLLVGDSLGMVIAGETSTTKVTMDHLLYHTASVARGIRASKVMRKPRLISDLPIHSYDDPASAIRNAGLLKEVGASMVKIEGALPAIVRALRKKEISVSAHLGLTPQTIPNFKLQAKTKEEGERLLNDAKELERAGAEMLVLEMVPQELAKKVTEVLDIPTIGIGAGVHTNGQVLVLYDLLGFNADFSPKFLKKYANGYSVVSDAIKNYAEEVRAQKFPAPENSFRGEESSRGESDS